jgi:hypothetical protein
VADTVDRRRREGDPVADAQRVADRSPEAQALLAERTRYDGQGAGRAVVVVEAGVVAVRPADQPDAQVLVGVQLDVGALAVGIDAHVVGPELALGGEVRGDRAQLGLVEDPPREGAERAHAATRAISGNSLRAVRL